MKINEEVQYIWHDGIRIREEQLLSMARSAGSYALAEHYLISLLAHGTMYGLAYLINNVNEVREFYGVAPIPAPKNNYAEEPKPQKRDIADKVRKLYLKMTAGEHEELLCKSLATLMDSYPHLFKFKNHWQGIYLVVKDRLDYGLSQQEFLIMACKATPKGWPERLRINKSVVKNFSRGIQAAEAEEAYYEIADNPQKQLCDAFWEVLLTVIMMEKYGADTELV